MEKFDFSEPSWLRKNQEEENPCWKPVMLAEAGRQDFQLQWEQYFPPDPGFDMQKDIEKAGLTKKRPNFTQKTLIRESEYLILHFIGGPKNASQEIILRRAHRHIQDGQTFEWALHIDPIAFKIEALEKPIPFRAMHAIYKAVFIPLHETPFSEEQVVICIFHRQE